MQAEPVESITTMEAAAQARWLDAMAIWFERPADALGCAYLLGYVVECSLKAALGRVKNVLPAADLRAAVIGPLPPQDRHDCNKLLGECLNSRNNSHTTLGAQRQSEWLLHVRAVADAHTTDYRYKSYSVSSEWLLGMYEDVEWIVENIKELWI